MKEKILAVCHQCGDSWAATVQAQILPVHDLHAADAVYHHICSNNFRTKKQIPAAYQTERSCPKKFRRLKIDAESAFKKSKESLADATMLHHPHHNAPTSIATDASEQVVGAVSQQLMNVSWAPIAYFSKKLQPAQTKYSTIGNFWLYLAIKHFRHFIESREFHVLTDHRPLTFSLHAHYNNHSPRQARHLDFVAQFITYLRHISSADNAPADALSRMGITSVIQENLKGINFRPWLSTKCPTEKYRRLLNILIEPISN